MAFVHAHYIQLFLSFYYVEAEEMIIMCMYNAPVRDTVGTVGINVEDGVVLLKAMAWLCRGKISKQRQTSSCPLTHAIHLWSVVEVLNS